MSLSDLKFETSDFSDKGIASLSGNTFVGQAATLKAKFDEIGKTMLALGSFNDLIDALESVTDGSSGADNIGATAVSGLTGGTVQAILESLKAAIDAAILGQITDGTITDAKLSDTAGQIKSRVSCKNLLHNWDFRNPVNQRGGHIVLTGVTFYSDSSLTTSAGTTANAHTLTYVSASAYGFTGDGTDGTSGTTYYIAAANAKSGYLGSGYGFDRWKSNGSAVKAYQDTDGVSIIFPAGDYDVRQNVENYSSCKGLTLTLSVVVTAQTGTIAYNTYIGIYDGVGSSIVGINGAGTYSVTRTVSGSATDLYVKIANNSLSYGSTITIKSIKLELGSVSTLANDPPADYGEELAKCQRYFINLNALGVTYCQYGGGFANTTTNIRVDIPLPVPMRACPTATMNGNIIWLTGTNGNAITGIAAVADTTSPNSVRLHAATTGVTASAYYKIANYNDATAYIWLSADL